MAKGQRDYAARCNSRQSVFPIVRFFVLAAVVIIIGTLAAAVLLDHDFLKGERISRQSARTEVLPQIPPPSPPSPSQWLREKFLRDRVSRRYPVEELCDKVTEKHPGWIAKGRPDSKWPLGSEGFLLTEDRDDVLDWEAPKALKTWRGLVKPPPFEEKDWKGVVYVRLTGYRREERPGWHGHGLVKGRFLFYGDSEMVKELDRDFTEEQLLEIMPKPPIRRLGIEMIQELFAEAAR